MKQQESSGGCPTTSSETSNDQDGFPVRHPARTATTAGPSNPSAPPCTRPPYHPSALVLRTRWAIESMRCTPQLGICTGGFEKLGEQLKLQPYVTIRRPMNYSAPNLQRTRLARGLRAVLMWHRAHPAAASCCATGSLVTMRHSIAPALRRGGGRNLGAYPAFLLRFKRARSDLRHRRVFHVPATPSIPSWTARRRASHGSCPTKLCFKRNGPQVHRRTVAPRRMEDVEKPVEHESPSFVLSQRSASGARSSLREEAESAGA